MRRLPLALLATAVIAVQAAVASANPLASHALWVTRVSTPALLAEQARTANVRTLFVKAAEGATPEAQFTPALVAALRGVGITVCAWAFAYGVDPAGEAAAALAAKQAGAGCLVVDAESQYDGRYGAAQAYVKALRSGLGRHFPIALAGQAETFQHQKFPYSVFLGPGAFGLDLPQLYWREFGLTVQAAYRTTLAENAIYGRPIAPVGQLFNGPSPTEVEQFESQAAAFGLSGWSFFDLDAAEPAQLAALALPVVHPKARRVVPATVRPGADGDEVLWAQELLNASGARLPVGGFFGAQTARAIVGFQARHRLHRNGLLDSATWRALLRRPAREPSWAKAPPLSAR